MQSSVCAPVRELMLVIIEVADFLAILTQPKLYSHACLGVGWICIFAALTPFPSASYSLCDNAVILSAFSQPHHDVRTCTILQLLLFKSRISHAACVRVLATVSQCSLALLSHHGWLETHAWTMYAGAKLPHALRLRHPLLPAAQNLITCNNNMHNT